MITLIFTLITSLYAAPATEKKPVLTWAFASATKNPVIPRNANILGEKHPLFEFYQQELKDYKQQIMTGTLTRIEVELRNPKKLICYPGSSEFSRRREFSYLTSQYIQPAPSLVVTKTLGEKLLREYNGKITLAELIKNKTLKGSLAEGRSYGEEIDQLLKQSGPGNIKRHVYNTFIQTVIPQIKIGRIDYTLEYAFVTKSMEAEDKEKKTELMTIPLSDVEGHVTQYIACTKSPAGLEVIKKLDQIIMQNVGKDFFWQGVLNSLEDEEKAHFQQSINSFITHRKNHSVVIE